MAELIPEIRNTPRALIVRQSSILLLRKVGGFRGERFSLPGGAQAAGESLLEALNRECREEIDTPVKIGELLHVAEFFKLKDDQPPTRQHLVEFLFRCDIADNYIPHNGSRPDKHQVDVMWAHLDEIPRLALHPQYLSIWIPRLTTGGRNFYLGTFNDQTTS
ncbi:NUDIX domain-containing protein [Thiohalophilus sp.]|uniref:NUDIX domain-containing protein n=1 Tax=Thiohalophilus sp. TaxID=3028392 RepID=UPI0039768594